MSDVVLTQHEALAVVRLLRALAETEAVDLHTRADADVLARSLEALAYGRQEDRDELRAYPACREAASGTNSREVEHAYAGSGSLCGLPEPVIELMRHHFAPDRLDSCQRCAAAVRAERESGREPRTR